MTNIPPEERETIASVCNKISTLSWQTSRYNSGVISEAVDFASSDTFNDLISGDALFQQALLNHPHWQNDLSGRMNMFHDMFGQMNAIFEKLGISHCITTEGTTAKFHFSRKQLAILQAEGLAVPALAQGLGREVTPHDIYNVQDVLKSINQAVESGKAHWNIDNSSPGGINETSGGFLYRMEKHEESHVSVTLPHDLRDIAPSQKGLPEPSWDKWEETTKTGIGEIEDLFKAIGVKPQVEFTDGGVTFKFNDKQAAMLFSYGLTLPQPMLALVTKWVGNKLQQERMASI
jgi:hypothetical protein